MYEPVIEITPDKKIDILMAEIQERRSAQDKMRERGLQVIITVTAASGTLAWLLLTEQCLNLHQRILFFLLVAVLFFALWYFIRSIHKGFQNCRESLIKAETALGMHKNDVYLSGTTLLPTGYGSSKPGRWDFFVILSRWIVAVAIILGFLIFLPQCINELNPKTNQPLPEKHISPCQTSHQNS